MKLKQLRKEKKLTQKQASMMVDMPLRTYKNYENDEAKVGTIKYIYLFEKLEAYGYVDEEHGILNLDLIKSACFNVFERFKVEYCYLFGSYAKNEANEKSDVDLLVSTKITGLEFYALIENLRSEMKKKIDLLTVNQLKDNQNLLEEILKDGIKIYG